MSKSKLLIIIIALLPVVAFSHENLGTTIINVEPTTVMPGETIEVTFEYTVRNTADPAPYEEPQWRILLDAPYNYLSGILLSTGGNVHSIVGDLTYEVTKSITIPSDMEPGIHSIDVWTSAEFWWDTALSSDHIDISVIPPVLPVDIDIRPCTYPNYIVPNSWGLIPVAVFSDEDFDATTIDPATVDLAGAGVAYLRLFNLYIAIAVEMDVNCDGLTDLVFGIENSEIDPDQIIDGYAYLVGSTYDGQEIEGSDEVILKRPRCRW